MFNWHISRQLSAYAHSELAPDESRRVESHLAQCARCRKEFDEVRAGIALAESLPREEAPEFLWAQIEERIEARERGPLAQRRAWNWRAALMWTVRAAATCALLLFTLGVLIGRFVWNPVVKLRMAASPPSAFETAAYNLHLQNVRGELPLDYRATSPAALRYWLLRHSGLDADVHDRVPPPEEGKRFELVGAKIVQAAGVPAALITWRVDSRPVTLVTTRLGNMGESLSTRTLTSKEFSFRAYPDQSWKVLRWAREGQAYFMFTDLPEFGQQGCMFCHTDQMRRNRIRAMALVRD